MRFMSKIGTILLLFALIFQSFNTAIYAVSNLDENETTTNKAIIVIEDENEEDIPLLEEESDSSKVLHRLEHKANIKVLKEFDEFTYVEYIDENSEELLRGFVRNDYLIDSDDMDGSTSTESSNQNGENKADEKTSNDESNNDHDLNNSDSEDEKVDDTSDDNDDATVDEETVDKDSEIADEETEDVDTEVIEEDLNIDDNKEVEDEIEEQAGEENTNDEVEEDELEKGDNEQNVIDEPVQKFKTSVQRADIKATTKHQTTLRGVALKRPTKIYPKQSTKSSTLKSYQQGSILKYKTLNSEWYEAIVLVNGNYTTGYINVKDVENLEKSQTILHGVGLKSPTKVYQKASSDAKVIKSYQQGSILKYKSFTSEWYEATVYVNGKYTTGYINVNDVEIPGKSQTTFHGIGLKNPTKVYQKASSGANVLKSYRQGSILKYKSFTSGWYEATVYINGKPKTGYIHKSHVENNVTKQINLNGIALQGTTSVYGSASTSSKKLKSYAQGTILNYKTFSSKWYEATVYLNGKATTGYIHTSHVEELYNTQKAEKGLANKNPTKVYSRASQSSSVLKTYSRNSILKFETFSPNWYRATVYINGKKKTGYIHHNDVNKSDIAIDTTKYNHNFNTVLDTQMKGSPQVWKDGGFVDASREQVSYYLNSSNFKSNTSSYFQFLNLSSPAGTNANEINTKVLSNAGTLTGQAQAFIDAGKIYNVNEIYLMSHALHETGYGKSTLAKGVPVDKNGKVVSKSQAKYTVYNMYGYGAIDSDPLNGGAMYAFKKGWFTPEDAIIGGAKDIANNYINSGQNTLYKMRWNPASPGWPQYATDVAWALAQTININKIYESINSYILVYDVPVYNSQPSSSGDPNKYKDVKVSLEVTATSLNVRKGADTSYGSLGGVSKGNLLNAVLDKSNNLVKKTVNNHVWYQIQYNGSTAWVSGGKNGTEYIRVR